MLRIDDELIVENQSNSNNMMEIPSLIFRENRISRVSVALLEFLSPGFGQGNG